MKNRYIAIVVCILFSWSAVAQQKVLSKIPVKGSSIAALIPSGYDTLQTSTGDLNKDNVDDLVLVLRPIAEDTVEPGLDDSLPARLVSIYFKKGEQYELAGRSDGAILCKTCGGVFGDPFALIAIKKGVIVIDHYGGSNWRWAYTNRFRYQDNDFYLIGSTELSYFSAERCKKLNDFAATNLKDINYLTGDYVEKEISLECVLKKDKKGKMAKKPLTKMVDFILEN